jgi:pimeloyl-ACP methyl ester carboxylesterase
LRSHTHITKISGVDIHWEETGAGPAVVLVHGLSDWHRTWSPIAPLLAARGYRVVAVDLPGHGFSGRPDVPYTLEWNARVIGAWIDAVGLDRFSVVGHSYGGGVAQMLTLTHAARIDHIGLIAPGGFGNEVNLAVRLVSVPYVWPLLGQSLLVPLMFLTAPLGGRDNKDLAARAAVNGRPGTARALSRTARDVIRMKGQVRHFFDYAYDADFVPPTTVFWGDRDHVLPVAQATRACEALQGMRLVRFPNAGHYPHHDEPKNFTNELVGSLESKDAPTVTLPPAPKTSRVGPAIAV